jgi:hypothetical protein
MKKLLLIFIITSSIAVCQDIIPDTLENVESEFFEDIESDSQIDEIIEQLEFVRIELNRASVDDLTEIPFITREIALKIISYREKIGGFKKREQVFEIPDVDDLIKVFLYRNGYIQKPKLSLQARTRVLSKNNIASLDENFAENYKTYQLFRSTFLNFSAGFVFEKDYDERKLNDLTHFYIEYKSSGFFRKVVLGNYTIQFGQGILLWRPISLGKGSDAIVPVVRDFENYLSSYASTDEVKPMFGFGLNSKFKNFELTLFYSTTKLPSTIDSSGLVRSIDFSGLNPSEKVQTLRNLYGMILSFGRQNFSIEFLNYFEKFNRDFSREISRPFGIARFYSGFGYNFYFKNLNFFGEIASAKTLHFSVVSGINFSFKNLDLVFQYRNLNPNFATINGNVFGERYGEAWNEEGFYSGVKFRTGKFRVSGYYDVFKFPKFEIDDARNGTDYRIEASFSVSRNVELKLMVREKSIIRGIKVQDEFGRENLGEGVERRRNLRFEVENKFGKVVFRSRIEWVKRSLNDFESGFLIYQGVKFEAFKFLKFYGRVAYFRSDSYFSRVYVYEDDIDGVVSLIPLYGKGLRWYFVLKLNYGKILSFQFKYSETFLVENSSVRNLLGVQLGIKF